MREFVSGTQMKQLDRYTIQEIGIPSLVLMERAARSVYDTMIKERLPLKKVLVLCGSGNNGADGVALARMLHLSNISVDVEILGNPSHFTMEMKQQIEIAKKYQVAFVKNKSLSEYTTIVDAIFGVGLDREVGGGYKEKIKEINQADAKVVAVDIPSGIDSATGKVLGCAVCADWTVSFAYEKLGTVFYEGAEYAGNVRVADIGIVKMPEICFPISTYTFEEKDLKEKLFRRESGNKGTFGKVLLIAGNEMTSGATLLSASSALHTGAGMVKVHTRKENRAILPVQLPEAMYCFYGKKEIKSEALAESLEWADVVGIGPGLGTNKQAEALLEFVLKYSKRPLVIDADGLNLLKSKLDLLEKYEYPVIMTPHLGEFSRLSGLSIKDWKQQPIELTNELAHRYNVTLVCKDARTVIADGGQNVYVNTTGNSGMATAGSGDVLTGILLGLLAQGYAPLDAAVMGVCVHGLAGDEAAKEKGKYAMVAGDLITYTGDVLKKRG